MADIIYAVILFIPVVILLSWSMVYLFGRVSKRQLDRRKDKSAIMIIVGSGGHTTEILRLSSVLGAHYSPRYYIVATTDKISEEKIHVLEKSSANTKETQYEVHRIPRSREVKQSWMSTILSTLYACVYSLPLVFKLRPDLILCNGPGTCIPLCFSGILLKVLFIKNIKLVYVESICRVERLSLSAKLLYYFVDHMLVQWPDLQTKYPRTMYIGRVV